MPSNCENVILCLYEIICIHFKLIYLVHFCLAPSSQECLTCFAKTQQRYNPMFTKHTMSNHKIQIGKPIKISLELLLVMRTYINNIFDKVAGQKVPFSDRSDNAIQLSK